VTAASGTCDLPEDFSFSDRVLQQWISMANAFRQARLGMKPDASAWAPVTRGDLERADELMAVIGMTGPDFGDRRTFWRFCQASDTWIRAPGDEQ
jgi:hypothetical protein